MATKRKRGAQPKYTPELAALICERVAEGRPLKQVCADPDIPVSESTVRSWEVDDRDGFATLYARARAMRSEAMADEIVSIADDASEDPQSRRVRIDARKWLMSKMLPKRYGDKVAHEVSGKDGGPLEVNVTRRVVNTGAEG